MGGRPGYVLLLISGAESPPGFSLPSPLLKRNRFTRSPRRPGQHHGCGEGQPRLSGTTCTGENPGTALSPVGWWSRGVWRTPPPLISSWQGKRRLPSGWVDELNSHHLCSLVLSPAPLGGGASRGLASQAAPCRGGLVRNDLFRLRGRTVLAPAARKAGLVQRGQRGELRRHVPWEGREGGRG